jgi:hypothetical protein
MQYDFVSSPEATSSLHKPKARWSAEEDGLLLQAVEANGPSNWNNIAVALPGRTGKQCRERWITKLSPAFRSDAWTSDEDATLVRLQAAHGNQWAKFRAELPGRSTVSIKNRWVSLQRRGRDIRLETVVHDYVAPPSDVDGQDLVGIEEIFPFDEFSWGL